MNSQTDQELLRDYAWQHGEAAFAELVRRHIDLVYSAAMRMVLDRALAEDVTQGVFLALAQNAHKLERYAVLSAWLHTTTRNLAVKAIRTEVRRHNREREAVLMSSDLSQSDPIWQQLAPCLDEALAQLEEADRHALLLRYFEKKPFTAVGAALGLSENAARMRVDRALDKLRAQLSVKGITSTAAALSTALAAHVVGTAPETLPAQVISHALAGAAGVARSSGPGLGIAGKLGAVAVIGMLITTTGIALKQRKSSLETTTVAALAGGEADSSAGTNSESGAAAAKTGFVPRTSSERQGLELLFVDDKTRLPITNKIISLRGWERGSQVLVEKSVPLEEGRCVAPFEVNYLSFFWIRTRIDGYADTRLRWNTRRGEVVPALYTVRLVRPVLLHGRVVDSRGNPIAAARVGFGSGDVPGGDLQPEDHSVEGLGTTTDADGHWQVPGVAPDALAHLSASASHPYYTEASIDLVKQADAARQMLDGTFEFRLGDASVVEGRVLDASGQAVRNAVVRVGHVDEVHSRETRSRADGKFFVAGCSPGQQLVTANAPGFAPTVRQVIVEPNLPPLTLTLAPGRTLLMRVTDTEGQPIPGARVWFNTFQGLVPQVRFLVSADAEGRVVWRNAPDADLAFNVSASKHLNNNGFVLRPDDQEHIVTLSGGLTIAGTVRDADTGELLPRFRLVVGGPQTNLLDGPVSDPTIVVKPRWSQLDRFSPLFSKGEFRHELYERAVNNDNFIFRFEAEGYAPEVTRIYSAEEGEAWLDIRLRRSEQMVISVYAENGAAAAGAHVGLFELPSRIPVGPNGFIIRNSKSATWLRQANGQGKFVLPKENKGISQIVVAHPTGYAEAAVEDVLQTWTLRLRLWSTVEGLWLTNGQAVVNGEVSLRRILPETNEPRVMGDEYYLARTDSDGRYRFPQIPPDITYELQGWHETADGKSPGPSRHISSTRGATNRFVLGDGAKQQ